MALVKGTSYNNVFYDNVLQQLRKIITTDRACTVYVSPNYKDRGSFSIRMWGASAETDELFATEWRKVYSVEIALYTIGEDDSERFYEQLYSDAERLYQLLFNNVNSDTSTFPWYDGVVSEITFDDFTEEEEGVDGLHAAKFTFTCRISRAS